jgi:hypothetical protein
MTTSFPSVEDVVSSLKRADNHERSRWGQRLGAVRLGALVTLDYDGRRVSRNWALIDALKADDRVAVEAPAGTAFFNALISLRS